MTRVDENKVTINLGVPVTEDADTWRLVTLCAAKRKTPLVDEAT